MGRRNKALLRLGSRSVIGRQIETIGPLFDELLISASEPSAYERFRLDIVQDAVDAKGALAGIYSALAAARHAHLFVFACDMPFLNPGLIAYMQDLAPGNDVVIPVTALGREPLHAVYSKDCLKPIRGQLDRGDMKIIRFFDQVRVRPVREDELAQFDP